MKQDEIKSAWKELNDKISASSLANKKTLEYILKSQRKTAWQKLVSADRAASLFFLLITITISYLLLRENNGFILLKAQAIILLAVASTANIASYSILAKMNLSGAALLLYKQVASYKKLMIWTYLICYVLAIIFIVSFSYSYPLPPIVKILSYIALPVCVAIDYFLFHWSSNHIRTLIDTTKELNKPD